jgi:hypothetical protein
MDVNGARVARNVPLTTPATSLREAFAAGVAVGASLDRAGWLELIAGSSLQLECNLSGLNVAGTRTDRATIRVGIIANQEANCDSPNSYLGIGARPFDAASGACAVGATSTALTGNVQCSDGATAVDAFAGSLIIDGLREAGQRSIPVRRVGTQDELPGRRVRPADERSPGIFLRPLCGRQRPEVN